MTRALMTMNLFQADWIADALWTPASDRAMESYGYD